MRRGHTTGRHKKNGSQVTCFRVSAKFVIQKTGELFQRHMKVGHVTTQSKDPSLRQPVARVDISIMASGALMFILSFFPWVGFNLGFADITADAWAVGFFAWLPVMLCAAVAAALGAHIFLGVKLPGAGQVGPRGLLGLVSAFAVVVLFIRMVTLIAQSGPDSGGTRWALYAAFATAVVQLVLAYRMLKESGEKIPVLPGR